MATIRSLLSHATVGVLAALGTYATIGGQTTGIGTGLGPAIAQTAGTTSKEILTQPLPDIAREMRINLTERAPGNSSTPHRHPGHHTFGYVIEGTYEVRVDDGPVRQITAGGSFYEPPGSLHAVSRNPSADKPVKYLVIQIGDPTKPRTVPENPPAK